MQSWDEVRAWRRAERATLIARRLAVPPEERRRRDDAMTGLLLGELLERRPGLLPRSMGLYWPFKGEYDPRALARSLDARGVRLALPVVVERARPVVFRAWRPGAPMQRGFGGILVPAEGEALQPELLLVPLVGFDARGYRLGYGGGYYDRTLAAMPAKPLSIGVGFELSRLATIHPQPHDVPMDLIVTELGVAAGIAGAPPAGVTA
jgi:5-formyltetrahydrofolate cyclo-ligase